MKALRVDVPNLTAVTMDAVFTEAAALGEGPADGREGAIKRLEPRSHDRGVELG
jgi:hypothetical protein